MRAYKNRFFLLPVLVILLVLLSAFPSGIAFANSAKDKKPTAPQTLSLSNSKISNYVPGQVVVGFKDDQAEARLSQVPSALDSVSAQSVLSEGTDVGGNPSKLLSLNPGTSVEDAVQSLSSTPGIAFAEPNYIYKSDYTPDDPSFSQQWGLNNAGQSIKGTAGVAGADIKATQAWDIERGLSNPVTVAVVDSGVDLNHPDLKNKLWVNPADSTNGYNFMGISQLDYQKVITFGDSASFLIQDYAQSITGTGGDLSELGIGLCKVENPTSPITVSVRNSLGGPDLASGSIDPNSLPTYPYFTYVDVLLSNAVNLQAGVDYYIVVHTDQNNGSNYYGLIFSDTNPYAEGEMYSWWSASWNPYPTYDMSFISNPNSVPHDDFGHGTHCAGIVGAETNNTQGAAGTCPGAKIMPLKVSDCNGSLTTWSIAQAIYYAADNGANIISMSFGGASSSSTEEDAINYAHQKGLTLFASAGNVGDAANEMMYPAGYAGVIGVGATDNQDNVASFSEHNSSVAVSAPGVNVYSTTPTYPVYLTNLRGVSQNYAFLSGTSMACPMAAGVGALVLSKNPYLSNSEVLSLIESTADDKGAPGRDDYYGYGRVNAYNALLDIPATAHTASISVNPLGAGTASGGGTYPYNQMVNLQASPDAGYRFLNWTEGGNVVSDSANYSFLCTADRNLVANFVLNTYTVGASAGDHGTVTETTQTVNYGDNAIIHINPDAGYHIASIMDNTISQTIANPYVIMNVTDNHTVVVTFSNTYTIKASSASSNGTINPSGDIPVPPGSNQTFTFTPNNGYHISSIVVDGIPQGPAADYQFQTVLSDHTIVVHFAIDTNTVSASVSGDHGGVTETTQTVNYGENATIHITPDPHYHIDSIVDNNISQTIANPYVITNVTVAHTVVVTFAIDTHTITADASPAGTGTAMGGGICNYDASVSLTATPSMGYHFVNWTESGNVVFTDPDYSFICSGDRSLVANFAINTYNVGASVSGGHGTVSPASQTINYGGNALIIVTPEARYHITSITDNGNQVTRTSPYVINGVATDHTVVVTFAEDIHTFYFAEGYTGAGFEEWLCLMNPDSSATTALITYMFEDGTTYVQEVLVGATSRITVDVNSIVGPGKNVSVKITSAAPIVAERPMYFNYKGVWSGGHDVVGATSPQKTFYFAEGYTGAGFEEWLCLMNPDASGAAAHITYMFADGSIQTQDIGIGATSRATVDVNGAVGLGKNVSIKILSDAPIVAERPMYFDYKGKWSGGHDVVGTPAPQKTFYFAEGYTGAGSFDEWLCLMNPNPNPTTAHITYMFTDGSIQTQEVGVGATSRATVDVNGAIGLDKNVSVAIAANDPIVAERPMYFNYKGKWTGGHDVIGTSAPKTTFYFAEGYTGANSFDEWLCLANPNVTETPVRITYMFTDGTTQVQEVIVGANSRFTVDVNSIVGLNKNVSASVNAVSPIVAERPMYFNYKGKWTGGHDVIGY